MPLIFCSEWFGVFNFKMWSISVLVMVGVFTLGSGYLPLPSYLNACYKDSPDFDECVLKQAQLGLPLLLNGDRKYGIPKLNPIELEEISVDTDGKFKIKLTKVKIHGPVRAKITALKINPTAQTFNMSVSVNVLTILSKYDMTGRILVVPLDGKGDANITLTNIDFDYGFNFDVKKKKGEEYIHLVDQYIDYEMERAYVNFTNLFNGNQQLGDNTNKLLNEEWKPLADELKPTILETIKTVASSIIIALFEKVPIRFILP